MSGSARQIADYFEAKLGEIRANDRLPCEICIYFPRNNHLVPIFLQNSEPRTIALTHLEARAIAKVWIRNADRAAWERYQKGPSYDTVPGALIAETLKSKTIEPETKKAIVASTAKQVLANLAAATDPEAEKKMKREARKIIEDALTAASEQTRSLLSELWKAADFEPELEHAVGVSSYAVLFAMAFGRIDQELLGDLALAGLLHDIGLCSVNTSMATTPWSNQSGEAQLEYSSHVERGITLLKEYAPEASPRVSELILQHHEKFDGKGYPRSLQGFSFDDVAQLIAMAELGDSMGSGQADGTRRPIRQVFEEIEKLETGRTFPEYFNPEIFTQVTKWLRSATGEALDSASQIVGRKIQAVLPDSGEGTNVPAPEQTRAA